MAIKLQDSMGHQVEYDRNEIKDALLRTDMVQDEDEIISISRYYSGEEDEDEYNVYDSRCTFDPETVYDIEELEDALDEFMELIATL